MDKRAVLLEKLDQFLRALAKPIVYGPYTNSNDRLFVILKYEDGTTRTVSYPKYLMEKHLGRVLDENEETVDHIDRDHHNNDLNNLRIVPRSQHSADDTRRVKLIDLKCSLCGKKFQRSPRLLRDKSKKGKSGVFCSRQCAGTYGRRLDLGRLDKFPVQPYIESEYYRNIKATLDRLITKYSGI